MPSVHRFAFKISLRPSRFMMGFLLLTHLVALLLAMTLSLQWWAQGLIALIVLSNLIYSINKHVYYKTRKAIREFRTDEGKVWYLTETKGTELTACLMGDSLVTMGLLILNFRLENKSKRSIMVFKDAVDSSAFRQLRVILLAQRK
ncbi:MAG: hypothetical protein EXR81_02540 [Gammaproteobacteria bacterium]|nr:hypothetical protein [Gammaproteobacteria bacterium]